MDSHSNKYLHLYLNQLPPRSVMPSEEQLRAFRQLPLSGRAAEVARLFMLVLKLSNRLANIFVEV